jgi:hypothetical protein
LSCPQASTPATAADITTQRRVRNVQRSCATLHRIARLRQAVLAKALSSSTTAPLRLPQCSATNSEQGSCTTLGTIADTTHPPTCAELAPSGSTKDKSASSVCVDLRTSNNRAHECHQQVVHVLHTKPSAEAYIAVNQCALQPPVHSNATDDSSKIIRQHMADGRQQ